MHAAARSFLEEHSHLESKDDLYRLLPAMIKEGQAIDFGGRYVNGDVHDLWPDLKWTVVDNHPDPIVMQNGHPSLMQCRYINANAARWTPDIDADLVICTEVFEHTKEWPSLCKNAHSALTEGGVFLVTAASEGRASHSMFDGGPLREHEYYENVSPVQLGFVLKMTGFHTRITYNPHDNDVYAVAIKHR